MVQKEFKTLLLAAILLPIAIGLVVGANVTGWDATTTTVFLLLPVIAVVGIILKMLNVF